MTPESLTGVVHRLRLAIDPAPPQRSDADLVRTIARHRDPAAFADVVRRHGPMVLGTCRRMLRDHTDAEDAFQATFLVFLRRAAALRHPERLAGWLFQVAYRTSRKLRAARLARRSRETELFDLPAGEPPAEFIWRELRPIFDAELDRLPDRLRLPAVLCLLEGRSKRDAARTLGWPEGTVAGRLQQARETLRRRFTARGLTLSAGALAVALFEGAGAVAVPPALFASTIHGLALGSASAGAAALADGVVHAMFVTKVKAITAAVLLTGIVGTGTGVVLTPGPGPAVVVAGEPTKEKGPAPRDVERIRAIERDVLMVDLKSGREQRVQKFERFREAEQKYRQLYQQGRVSKNEYDGVVDGLTQAVEDLRRQKSRVEQLVQKGFIAKSELDQVTADLARAEADLAKLSPPPADPKRADPEELERALKAIDREKLRREIEQLRERKTYAEKMVAKGLMAKAELDVATYDLAKAEAALAKLDPPPADPKRANQEEVVRKLTAILARTEEGFKKQVVPELEVLEARLRLLRAQFELELLTTPADQRAADRRKESLVLITLQHDNIVNRMEQLVSVPGIIPEAELRHTRARAAVMKAELHELVGQYDKAVGHREAAVREVEAILKMTVSGQEKGVVATADVRAAMVAVAEAKANAHRAGLKKELAEIVTLREEEVRVLKKRAQTGATTQAEVKAAEQALADARARLADGR